jgi:ABC-type dipeptide/oligopeptide/nickel transport system permease component
VRSSLIDVFHQDYIRTARAKGLAETAVIVRHSLKNALIPVVTLVSVQIGVIIEGAIVTESVFAWPGVGRLVVASIGGRDYPVVQAVVLVGALAYMFSSLIADIVYAWLDPRISYGSRKT